MPQIIWLLEEAVRAIHERQIIEHGGRSGTRDEGLVLSALARPQHLLAYGDPPPDAAALAAAYAFGIARNHPFIDGNKRTALVATRTFLLLNGFDLNASQEEKYLTYLQLAKGDIEENTLAEWIREHLNQAT